MSYLVDPSDTESGDWTELFDLIIVGSCKPAFLLDSRRDLFRVDKATGQLTNTDGVYEIAALEPNGAAKFLAKVGACESRRMRQWYQTTSHHVAPRFALRMGSFFARHVANPSLISLRGTSFRTATSTSSPPC